MENINKYFIEIESMYTQGVGGFQMISSDKDAVQMLRFELLKNIKNVEYISENDKDRMCGWEFYENIYKIVNIEKIDECDSKYTLFPIHDHTYIPSKSKVKNLKKVNWDKKINKKNNIICEDKFMVENLVYNTMDDTYCIMDINNFNILGDQKKRI